MCNSSKINISENAVSGNRLCLGGDSFLWVDSKATLLCFQGYFKYIFVRGTWAHLKSFKKIKFELCGLSVAQYSAVLALKPFYSEASVVQPLSTRSFSKHFTAPGTFIWFPQLKSKYLQNLHTFVEILIGRISHNSWTGALPGSQWE